MNLLLVNFFFSLLGVVMRISYLTHIQNTRLQKKKKAHLCVLEESGTFSDPGDFKLAYQ